MADWLTVATLVVTWVAPLYRVSSAIEYAPPSPAELAVIRTRTNSVDTGSKVTI